MFDKLKLKFILINMSLLTVVFISIFGTLYFMTNESMNRETNGSLNALMIDNHKSRPNTSNIIVDVDDNGNIIKKFISFNLNVSTNDLQNAINKILNNKKDSSKININQEPYVYLKRTSSTTTKIVFLNISIKRTLSYLF